MIWFTAKMIVVHTEKDEITLIVFLNDSADGVDPHDSDSNVAVHVKIEVKLVFRTIIHSF